MAEADATKLLRAIEQGDPDAMDRLFTAVYEELRRIARSERRARRASDTMSTTALVHEAYLKIAGRSEVSFKNRVHFFATAAKVIRHVVANYAERRRAVKRGGGIDPLPFDERLFISDSSAEEALAIHEAISCLEKTKPRSARVLECRIFGRMTVEETASALSISPATVKRDWATATTWLYGELQLSAPVH